MLIAVDISDFDEYDYLYLRIKFKKKHQTKFRNTSGKREAVNLSYLNGKTSCIRVRNISNNSQSYWSVGGQTHIDVN